MQAPWLLRAGEAFTERGGVNTKQHSIRAAVRGWGPSWEGGHMRAVRQCRAALLPLGALPALPYSYILFKLAEQPAGCFPELEIALDVLR